MKLNGLLTPLEKDKMQLTEGLTQCEILKSQFCYAANKFTGSARYRPSKKKCD